MRRLLPLGFSRTEIRQQLYLSSNSLDTAACRLLDKDKEERRGGEGEREGQGDGGEGVMDGSQEGTEQKKNFTIGKFEVCMKHGTSVYRL